jgi:hypothetical protein
MMTWKSRIAISNYLIVQERKKRRPDAMRSRHRNRPGSGGLTLTGSGFANALLGKLDSAISEKATRHGAPGASYSKPHRFMGSVWPERA